MRRTMFVSTYRKCGRYGSREQRKVTHLIRFGRVRLSVGLVGDKRVWITWRGDVEVTRTWR